jgi:hypothetical protein
VLKTALQPRWIAGLVFAIAVSGVFVLLSQWQFGRSTQPEPPVNPSHEEGPGPGGNPAAGDFFPGSVADQMVSRVRQLRSPKQVLVEGRL